MGEGGRISLQAPCKINLHLSIGGRRPDGFHDLESVFSALDFADTLTFAPLPGKEGLTTISLLAEGPFLELSRQGIYPPIPVENNLVCRATELFRAKTGFSRNLAVELVKRIPPGSGLGGGSSDAATTLLALNTLANDPLSCEELLELAAQLGSDVPFFIQIAGSGKSPACAVSGRGEILEPLPPPPPLGVLLAFPGFASDTRAAYELLDETRKKNKPRSFTEFLVRKSSFLRVNPCNPWTKNLWPSPESWDFTNDFLDVFLNHGMEQEKRAYGAILQDLRAAGAIFAGLSGSGSACFGIFSGPDSAEKAREGLLGTFYTLKTTFFLHSEKTGYKIR